MNTPKFIKLTADNDGELLDITLNTSNIDSYVVPRKDGTENGTEPKCRLSISSYKDSGCDIIYVMETKEYLDKILT